MVLLVCMSRTNEALSSIRFLEDLPVEDLPVEGGGWADELEHLFARAAELAARHGLDSETFMSAAWNACLDARPGLREELAEKELRAQLRKLRKRGLVGSA